MPFYNYGFFYVFSGGVLRYVKLIDIPQTLSSSVHNISQIADFFFAAAC